MPDLDDVRRIVTEDHGLVVISTGRADGTIQSSVVNAGVLRHPMSSDDVVGCVVRGDSRKLGNLRRRQRATVTFRSGWRWITVEGAADLVGPDDPFDGVDAQRLRLLLREVFEAAGGTHDDFETYDRVMAEERRCAVLIRPDRIYGVTPG